MQASLIESKSFFTILKDDLQVYTSFESVVGRLEKDDSFALIFDCLRTIFERQVTHEYTDIVRSRTSQVRGHVVELMKSNLQVFMDNFKIVLNKSLDKLLAVMTATGQLELLLSKLKTADLETRHPPNNSVVYFTEPKHVGRVLHSTEPQSLSGEKDAPKLTEFVEEFTTKHQDRRSLSKSGKDELIPSEYSLQLNYESRPAELYDNLYSDTNFNLNPQRNSRDRELAVSHILVPKSQLSPSKSKSVQKPASIKVLSHSQKTIQNKISSHITSQISGQVAEEIGREEKLESVKAVSNKEQEKSQTKFPRKNKSKPICLILESIRNKSLSADPGSKLPQ